MHPPRLSRCAAALLAALTLCATVSRAAAAPAEPAEPTAPLTLQAAMALATQANPSLSAARFGLLAVDAGVQQAGARPNPSLSVEVQDQRRATRETTWQLSQPLELGGKRGARITVAERERDIAAAALAMRRAELHADVLTGFFDVLVAQERLRLSAEAVQLAQRAAQVAAKRVTAGKISPVEASRAKVAEAGMRLEHVQAERALGAARKRLSALWANPVPRFERADGDLETLPALPGDAAWQQRRAASPAFAHARLELDRRQALSQLALANRTPDVTVNVGVKRSQELGRNQAIVGLAVPLPLFDRNAGNVTQALRLADQAGADLAATELRLEGELAQAVDDLASARHSIATLRQDITPDALNAYEAAIKGFEFGKLGFLDVLDAQRTLLQVRTQYLEALSTGHRAAAAIERVLGHAAPANDHQEQP